MICSYFVIVRPIRDSNPCRRRERVEKHRSFAGIFGPPERPGQIMVKDPRSDRRSQTTPAVANQGWQIAAACRKPDPATAVSSRPGLGTIRSVRTPPSRVLRSTSALQRASRASLDDVPLAAGRHGSRGCAISRVAPPSSYGHEVSNQSRAQRKCVPSGPVAEHGQDSRTTFAGKDAKRRDRPEWRGWDGFVRLGRAL
jgi:hypothetical protein